MAALLAAGAAVSGCSPLYAALSQAPGEIEPLTASGGREFRILSHLTYGPRSDERHYLAQIGIGGWLEEQLAPDSLSDPGADWRLRPLDVTWLEARDLMVWDQDAVIDQLQQATLLRRIYSRRQLYELMVEFWSDHFNISVLKGDCWFLKPVDDRQVIRAHALGNFRQLLHASAHSPAMLVYLDNQANVRAAPNENYARELMELHTLGIDGGYRQQDVMELARAFTGWTVKEHFWPGEFKFDAEQHDPGSKKVLDLHLEPAGKQEAERVLDRLAQDPATAARIVAKLARRFLGGQSAELQAHATQVFLDTGGEIAPTLSRLLLEGLQDPDLYLKPRVKRPVEYVVSALRILQAETDAGAPIRAALGAMGQAPFEWPAPDGPPDDDAHWRNHLMPRWKFALDLVQGGLEGTRLDLDGLLAATGAHTTGAVIDEIARYLLGGPLPGARREALLAVVKAEKSQVEVELPSFVLAALLASPSFQIC